MIKPLFKQWAEEFEGRAILCSCDVDSNKETSRSQGVQAMPTFKFYKGGKEVHMIQGADQNSVRAKIDELAGAV